MRQVVHEAVGPSIEDGAHLHSLDLTSIVTFIVMWLRIGGNGDGSKWACMGMSVAKRVSTIAPEHV